MFFLNENGNFEKKIVFFLLGLWYWNLVEKECLWNHHLRHHLKNVYVRKPKEESMCFFHWFRAEFEMKNDPKKFREIKTL